MIANVILGINMDTGKWIKDLESNLADNIIVLDYEYTEEPKFLNNILYISPLDLSKYIKSFDSVRYYKSMYVFPEVNRQKYNN